jgi:hypothetical protein
MFFASLLAFRKYMELATVLQVFGCFVQGFLTFTQIGILMAFNSLNFWEVIISPSLLAVEFYSFIGFCVIAVSFLILEYKKYHAKKPNNSIV